MPDTPRTTAALQTIFADTGASDISPQDARDFIVSVLNTVDAPVTTFAKTILDDTSASAARTTLGLGTAAVSATGDFAAAVHVHSAADVTSGTLAVARGGTGQVTATAAFDALAPTQTSNSGKYLTTNGSTTSWGTVSASPGGSSGQVQYNSSSSFAGVNLWVEDANTLSQHNSTNAQTFKLFQSYTDAGNNNGWQLRTGSGDLNLEYIENGTGVGNTNYITLNAKNGMYFSVASAPVVKITANAVAPYTTNAVALGGTSNRFTNFYAQTGNLSSPTRNCLTLTPDSTGTWDGMAALYFPIVASTNVENRLIRYGVGTFTLDANPDTSVSMFLNGGSGIGLTVLGTCVFSDALTIQANGAISPAHLADSAAANDTIYYSTDAGKLVYKSSGGVVNNLY